MLNMNNKGQVLVLFVIILPIIIFILFIVVDIGNIYLKKNEILYYIEAFSLKLTLIYQCSKINL